MTLLNGSSHANPRHVRPITVAAFPIPIILYDVDHPVNHEAEALTLAEAAGIDPSLAYLAFEESAAAAPMLHYRKPQYLDEAANPVSFALSLAGKDVGLAIDLGAELGVPLPQAQLNLDQLNAAEASGFGDRDMASIINYLRGLK